MDWDARIKMLEAEIEHAHVMRRLASERLDAHDQSLEIIRQGLVGAAERLDRIETALENLIGNVDQLAGNVDRLAGKVDALVAAMLRTQTNGQ